MTEKVLMRKEIKERLNKLKEKENLSNLIKNNLLALKEFQSSERIFIYISFGNEVNTGLIIKDSLSCGKRVFVPYITGDYMEMLEIDKETLFSVNKFGIKEPVYDKAKLYKGDIDLAVIPLIGFDKDFSRLGRGGGFYDKFLKDRDCIKIAIAFSIQEADKLPVEPHDIKVDMIVTEKGIIR